MDNYKKKSLNFSRTCDNRELRAYRRSEDRRNIKHARLSALRGIDDKVIDTSIIEEEKKKEEIPVKKVEKPNVNQRAEMLKKWKEEKELKRKLEQKKPAFVVSRVAFKPNSNAIPSLKKDDSKPLSAFSNLRKIAAPKTGNVQNMTRLPRAPVSRPAPPKVNLSSGVSKLPSSKPTCVSKALTTIPKPSFKPQAQIQLNKQPSKGNAIATRSTQPSTHGPKNAPKIAQQKNATIKAPPSIKPTFLPNSVPGRKPAITRPAVTNSPALKNGVKVTPNSQNNKPKSFAPANFLFKVPLNVKKIIFPHGVPNFSSKQMFNKGNPDSKQAASAQSAFNPKIHESKKTNQTQKNTFGFCKTPKKIQTLKITDVLKNPSEAENDLVISEKSAEKTHSDQESPKLIETKKNLFLIPDVLKTMHSSNEEVSSKSCEAVTIEGNNDLCEKVMESNCDENLMDEENHFQMIAPSLESLDVPSVTKDEINIVSEETESSDETALDKTIFGSFSGLKNNPFLIPVALQSMQFPVAMSEEHSENHCSSKTVEKAELSQLSSAVKFVEVDSVSVAPSVEEKENEPPQNEQKNEVKDIISEKLDQGGTQDTFGKLHTICEDLEIFEEVSSATKNRLKQMTQGNMTPRRSRRLASLHEKMMSGLDRVSMQGTPSKILAPPNDLAEEMSLLNVNEMTSEAEDKVQNLTPPVNRRGRPSTRNARKETAFSEDADSTPSRPMTRQQQRKVSLLGSPQMLPAHLSRKSIREDLMIFSPEP